MDLTRLTHLYRQYQANQLTEQEREEWEAILLDVSKDEAIQHLIDSEWQLATQDDGESDKEASERVYRFIISHRQQRKERNRLIHWMRYAAAAIVAVTAGYLLLHEKIDRLGAHRYAAVSNVMPGGNKAVLTLADGQIIGLSPEHAGIIIGDRILYDNGDVIAELKEGDPENANLKLTVPRGGTYRVTLSDSTKIWLNAESTLRYPLRFGGERKIFLTGEGYFEVANDKKKSFVVSTAGLDVAVLGTQFNMTAYPNEATTKTTLVEGKVKISHLQSGLEQMLNPGQQSIAVGTDLEVKEVNTSQFTAWKDGYFSFDKTPFPEVLEQLGRWYNIEIHYKEIPVQTFSGKMKRDAQLLSVLDFLKGSGIRFQLVGRKLIIS